MLQFFVFGCVWAEEEVVVVVEEDRLLVWLNDLLTDYAQHSMGEFNLSVADLYYGQSKCGEWEKDRFPLKWC